MCAGLVRSFVASVLFSTVVWLGNHTVPNLPCLTDRAEQGILGAHPRGLTRPCSFSYGRAVLLCAHAPRPLCPVLPLTGLFGCPHARAPGSPGCREHRGVNKCFQILGGRMPEEALLGQVVALLFVFRGIAVEFSTAVVPVHLPTGSERGFPSLHGLPRTCHRLSCS